MTFFSALILLPPEASKYEQERLVEVIDRLIQPADQSFPDQPYLIPCRCIGYEVHRSGIKEANRKVGSFCTLGQAYLALPPSKRPRWSEYPPVIHWQTIAQQAARLHPNYSSPRLNCEYCQGSGRMEETGNQSEFVGYDYWANADPSEFYLGSSRMFRVRELPEDLKVQAVVTPHGEWHEIDTLNHNGNPWEEWYEKARQLWNQYPDHIAVKLRMHS